LGIWRERKIRRRAGYLDTVLDGESGERVHPADRVLQVVVVGGAARRRRRRALRREHGATECVVLVGQRVRDPHANQSSARERARSADPGGETGRWREEEKRRGFGTPASNFASLRFFLIGLDSPQALRGPRDFDFFLLTNIYIERVLLWCYKSFICLDLMIKNNEVSIERYFK
jgi:hypothetical protein